MDGMTTRIPSPETHVVFPVEKNQVWPRILGERLRAKPLGEDRYEIISAPYFVRDIAVGDVVRASSDAPEPSPVFREALVSSEHATIHLKLCCDRGTCACDETLERFAGSPAVEATASKLYCKLALDVGPDAEYTELLGMLVQGREDGLWEFEVTSASPGWDAATGADEG